MPTGITVVVPIYNVAQYLPACLESIARQTFTDLQVVMVDDGSTDNSADIAAEFAAKDPRFQLVKQANGGLGAARNTGTDHADGKYLAFLDSDDVVPAHAYESLYRSLEETGSDFATGVVRRFGRASVRKSRLTPFTETVQQTHVLQRPQELLLDRIATNKLWRRAFWDANGFRFPEGVLYEDIALVLSAQVIARSVDILNKTVYWWRERGESITTDRAQSHGIGHRMRAVRQVVEDMGARGLSDLQRQYEALVLADDMLLFVNAADEGAAEYRQTLVEQTRELLAYSDPAALDDIPAIDRLKYHLLERGMVEEMLDVLTFERTQLRRASTIVRGSERFGAYPFFEDPQYAIPNSVYRLNVEMQAHARLDGVAWDRGKLRISGFAYVDRVEAKRRGDVTIRLVVRSADGAERRIKARGRRHAGATFAAAQAGHSYDGSGFVVRLNPRDIFGERRGGQTAEVGVEVSAPGVSRETFQWDMPAELHRSMKRRRLSGRIAVKPSLDGSQLTLSTEWARAITTSAANHGEVLELRGTIRGRQVRGLELVARRRSGDVAYTTPVEVTGLVPRAKFRVRIDAADVSRLVAASVEPEVVDKLENGISWQLRVQPGGARFTADDAMNQASAFVGGTEFHIRPNRHGHAVMIERAPHPLAVALDVTDEGVVHLEGTLHHADGPVDVILRRHGAGEEHRFRTTVTAGTFRVDVPTLIAEPGGEPAPLRVGQWDLFVGDPEALEEVVAVEASTQVLRQLPLSFTIGGRPAVVNGGRGNRVAIEVTRAGRRSPRQAQAHRDRVYARRKRSKVRDVVVFQNRTGRAYGGDPRAIAERLQATGGLDARWIAPADVDGVPAVKRNTAEHAELLATARWIVTDDLLPTWWTPRDGQRVLQTWHGIPVKRTAAALHPDAAAAARVWLAELRRQAPAWDSLVAPTEAAADVLRATLGYDGRVAVVGPPRLDVVAEGAGTSRRTQMLREKLEISPDERVVLWAPTARNDGLSGRRRGLSFNLDIRSAEADLGQGCRYLLRRHPAMAQRASTKTSGWTDVSNVPDPVDLLLAADVLVTDYSSLALDFLATGRPLVFFAPDLERFVERSGGLLVDLFADGPGPVATTSAAAVDAVVQVLNETARPAGYTTLRDRYLGALDGKAAQRAVEQILLR